jgi:hypothetical protein
LLFGEREHPKAKCQGCAREERWREPGGEAEEAESESKGKEGSPEGGGGKMGFGKKDLSHSLPPSKKKENESQG